MHYETIIFDLDGTLRESQPRFMDALHDCLAEMDIHVDGFQWRLTERWVHKYWAQSSELLEDIQDHGPGQIWSRFLARLMAHAGHAPATEEEAQALGAHMRQCYQPDSQLMPGVGKTLETLQATGVTLGVLSNREHDFSEELEHLGIAGHFHFTLAAGEVGIWKPQPGIFQEALARAGGVSPQAALYIGDNYYADVVGAGNAGIDAILIDDRHVFTDMICPRVERIDEVLTFIIDD